MSKEEIDVMVNKYKSEIVTKCDAWNRCQYDDRSAEINYSFIREYKPKVVLEFGSNSGRCTFDILQALIKNGEDFTFNSYELENDRREEAQNNLNKGFGDKAIKIGEDVTKSVLPNNIDYLFIDNNHDRVTTEWVFSTLLKQCTPNCIIQIHDIPLMGNYELRKEKGCGWDETAYILDLLKEGKLPIEKIYFANEEGSNIESSWWKLKNNG